MAFPGGTPRAQALIYILIYELQWDEEKGEELEQPAQTFSEEPDAQ